MELLMRLEGSEAVVESFLDTDMYSEAIKKSLILCNI
jgi:hypothetical protein